MREEAYLGELKSRATWRKKAGGLSHALDQCAETGRSREILCTQGMRSGSADPIVVQIPPETSPLMLPTQGHRRVVYSHHDTDTRDDDEDYQLEPNYRSSDLVDADDLEFVAPGQWDGLGDPNLGGRGHNDQYTAFGDDDDDDDDVPDFDMMDDDHDVEDWTLEDGHVDGVPCCNVRLDAK